MCGRTLFLATLVSCLGATKGVSTATSPATPPVMAACVSPSPKAAARLRLSSAGSSPLRRPSAKSAATSSSSAVSQDSSPEVAWPVCIGVPLVESGGRGGGAGEGGARSTAPEALAHQLHSRWHSRCRRRDKALEDVIIQHQPLLSDPARVGGIESAGNGGWKFVDLDPAAEALPPGGARTRRLSRHCCCASTSRLQQARDWAVKGRASALGAWAR